MKRDLKYLDGFMSDGYAPVAKEIKQLLTIYKVYEQQEYMYKNKTLTCIVWLMLSLKPVFMPNLPESILNIG